MHGIGPMHDYWITVVTADSYHADQTYLTWNLNFILIVQVQHYRKLVDSVSVNILNMTTWWSGQVIWQGHFIRLAFQQCPSQSTWSLLSFVYTRIIATNLENKLNWTERIYQHDNKIPIIGMITSYPYKGHHWVDLTPSPSGADHGHHQQGRAARARAKSGFALAGMMAGLPYTLSMSQCGVQCRDLKS